MLWTNGQRRQAREMRERMTEMYHANRDGLIEVVGAAVGDKTMREAPWYTRDPDAPAARGLTGAALEAALAGWALEFPGNVKLVEN